MVDAGTLAILSKPIHGVRDLTVCIWPLTVLGTAKVNGTPDYGDRVIDFQYDNGSTGFEDIRRGHIIRITRPSDNDRLIYEGTLRKRIDLTTIHISAQRQGDTGTAQNFAQYIQDNDDVTVYNAIRPDSFLSRLVEEGDELVLYKREDLSFATGYPQTQYPEPHARILEENRIIRVATGANATFVVTDDSTDFKGDALDRLWKLDDGITIVSGVDTDASITVEAPAGNYALQLEAHRVGGVEGPDFSSCWRRIFVVDGVGGDNPAFSDLFNVTIEGDDTDETGRVLTLVVTRSLADAELTDYLYLGAFVLIQETPVYTDDSYATYDTLTGDDGFVHQYAGYIRKWSVDVENSIVTWRIQIQSPIHFTEVMIIPSQSIRAVDPPTKWEEASSDLMRPDYWLYAIAYYHAYNLNQWHSFRFDELSAFALGAITWSKGTIAAAWQEIASRVAGASIGCASNGSFYAKRNPALEDDAYRAATENVITLTDAMVGDGQENEADPYMKVGRTTAVAVESDTDEVPDFIEGESGYLAPTAGVNDVEMPGFIALDQDDALDRIGHRHAELNRKTSDSQFELTGNLDIFEPAKPQQFNLDIPSYNPLDPESFSTARHWYPKRVNRQWAFVRGKGTSKKIIVTGQPETKGFPAVLVPPYPIGNQYNPPGISTAYCHKWDFTGGDPDIWTAISGTSFATDRFVSVNDWVRIEATLPMPITLTEVSFFYGGPWTNASSSAAKMYLYDQGGLKASLANITWQMKFTGLNLPGVSYIKLWWDHYPNPIWVAAYAVTGVQIKFIATSNPWGVNNCT